MEGVEPPWPAWKAGARPLRHTGWGDRRGSNPRRPGTQPGVLPTELQPPSTRVTLTQLQGLQLFVVPAPRLELGSSGLHSDVRSSWTMRARITNRDSRFVTGTSAGSRTRTPSRAAVSETAASAKFHHGGLAEGRRIELPGVLPATVFKTALITRLRCPPQRRAAESNRKFSLASVSNRASAPARCSPPGLRQGKS